MYLWVKALASATTITITTFIF